MKKTFTTPQAAEAIGTTYETLRQKIQWRLVEKPVARTRRNGFAWTLTEMKVAAKAIGRTKEFNQWNRKRIDDKRCANK